MSDVAKSLDEIVEHVDPHLSVDEKKAKLVADLKEQIAQEKSAGDTAAAMYQMYVPIFKGKLTQLTAADTSRLLIGLIEVPFAKREYNALTPNEKEAYLIGQTLLECKTVMLMQALQQDEINKMQDSIDKPTEIVDTKETEQTNG